MATRNYTILKHDTQSVKDFNALALGGQAIPTDQHRVYLVQWTGILNGDFGNWFVPSALFTDRSVHIFGTLGVGGSISIEVSNEVAPTDGVAGNAVIVQEPFGNAALTVTAIPAFKQLGQACYAVRPHCTAGDGTTSFTVNLLLLTPARA